MQVAISFLKSNYDLNETISRIVDTDAEYIHVDIMDGKFVNNNTLQYQDLKDILRGKRLDVHLMVENPLSYIMDFKNLNPEFITIHEEIEENIYDLLDLIHSFGIKAGISINPHTSVDKIKQYLNTCDNVLIMSVEPGLGGQQFDNSVVSKIDELRKLREENNYTYKISIDGGINDKTIEYVSGVDFVISGSFICCSDNYQDKIDKLRK